MARLSSENQITIPVDVLREAGLQPGDEVRLRTVGPGRIEIERVEALIKRWDGTLPYPEGYLEELRNEWEQHA